MRGRAVLDLQMPPVLRFQGGDRLPKAAIVCILIPGSFADKPAVFITLVPARP
jgi:hypothetical protein